MLQLVPGGPFRGRGRRPPVSLSQTRSDGRLTSLFFWGPHLLRRTLVSLFWAELSRIARGLQRGHFRHLSVLLYEVILASACHWAALACTWQLCPFRY